MDTYLSMSNQALALTPRPQVVIWPETSYPSTFRTPQTAEERARDQRVEDWVKLTHTPLLFGGYDHEEGKDFNALFALSETSFQTYRKNVLLPFGEYIPGMESVRWVREQFPQVGYFGRGKGPDVLALAAEGGVPIRFSPIICYEALFSNYILAAARQGSQFILNVTNDSWFGRWGEPHLHLALSVFRSIEARLPQIRSTNTGISALILPTGELLHQGPLFEPKIMTYPVPLNEPIWSLVKVWGDWFGPAAFFLALGFLLLSNCSPKLRKLR
jgi:apolipoprotein N-acyltransferase